MELWVPPSAWSETKGGRGRTLAPPSASSGGAEDTRRREMILATTKVEDFDRFLEIFSTKGAEKRKQHGSKASTVFRDPNENDRVWVFVDWGRGGCETFAPAPGAPPILQEAGHKGKPQAAELG